jgi:enoyl-CoA hydratase/carnithine racemase
MATMTEPQVKPLVTYRAEDGLAIIELDDPPANTYTYEMMRQLDDAILRARFDDTAHVIVIRGHGVGGREHRDAQQGHAAVQVFLLPARE